VADGRGRDRVFADAASHGALRLSGLPGAVKPTTRTRVDLVLRLDGAAPGGRLLDGSNSAGGGLNVRLALQSADELDEEALDFLRQAYEASS
jgi:hypothetical protein